MMRLLVDRSEIQRCYDVFVEVCRRTADEVALHRASFRPGRVERPAYFYRDEDFWIMPTDGSGNAKSEGKRYWNCFGLGGSPDKASTRITIEINHPHEGINRQLTGRFLREGSTFVLAHTGRLGGGGQDARAHAFENSPTARKMERTVVEGTEVFVVARMKPDTQFVSDISRFVQGMAAARRGDDD